MPLAFYSEQMEHRGVSYSLVEEQPGVWRWRVLIGNPQMLRMGEAASQHQADMLVRSVIDRALALKRC
jgi:hypothetical protein